MRRGGEVRGDSLLLRKAPGGRGGGGREGGDSLLLRKALGGGGGGGGGAQLEVGGRGRARGGAGWCRVHPLQGWCRVVQGGAGSQPNRMAITISESNHNQ